MSFKEEIAKELRTQDNRATSYPIYLVQERRRIWGMDSAFAENYAWVDVDDSENIADDEQAEELEQREFDDGKWEKVYYKDIFVTDQPFLTLKGAESYMAKERHNLESPRIFVASGWRNEEWKALLAFIEPDDVANYR